MEGEVNHERLWALKNNLRVLKGRGWEGGGTRWWVLGRAQIAWRTGCGEKTMNTVMLKINKNLIKKKKKCAELIMT